MGLVKFILKSFIHYIQKNYLTKWQRKLHEKSSLNKITYLNFKMFLGKCLKNKYFIRWNKLSANYID